ncbi:Down syndrome critical region protein 3-like isoform X1 [Dendronephthya gigantea]|uniref:Down syndrome critical region protein 3-like isoform X1 n=1 Tax=Dendronephthya gigantea TaxID=151771 RepID=UPI0010690111|nr:Down syndrome critical region protein 3-like isoform X1 [Dendronephthya gigantea]
MATLDIKVKRANKIYHAEEKVQGVIIVQSKTDLSHNGISLVMDGIVNLQLSAKSVGVFEAFYNSIKPITLVNQTVEIQKAGKLPAGKTELPFEIPLTGKMNKQLYETYHGVFVNIQYSLRCEMKRPMLSKDLMATCEFIVEYTKSNSPKQAAAKQLEFKITPDSLENVKVKTKVPSFLIKGKLDSTSCCITKPFTGEVTVVNSELPIKSIELQLVRVETCGCAEGYSKDATEIQNIQVGEGNVCTKLPLPIYMVFPRLFTCPSLATPNFKVEFEVNVVVVFNDDYLITENFPITLTRF